MIIQQTLKKIITEGGDDNVMIINLSEDYYIQGLSAIYDDGIFLEAVGNEYLPEDKQLNEKQINKLLEFSWVLGEFGNYECDMPLTTDDEIERAALLILNTAELIYGIKPINKNMIELIYN